MKIQITEVIDIDISKEFERIIVCFSGPCRERLENVISLFNKGLFGQSWQAYLDLPYSEESECPEQEFLPIWYAAFYEKYGGMDVGYNVNGAVVDSRFVEIL